MSQALIPDKPVVLIDPSRCVGCRSCEIACAVEHSQSKDIYVAVKEYPPPKPRIRVTFIWRVGLPAPLNCRHCEQAPCVEVCPTRALYRDEDGAVLLNTMKCIGCLMCGVACPFGVPELDRYNKIMSKCDLCESRRKEGKVPACVEACPTGALRYGKVSEVMMERREEFFGKYFEARKEGVESFILPVLVKEGETPLQAVARKSRKASWFER